MKENPVEAGRKFWKKFSGEIYCGDEGVPHSRARGMGLRGSTVERIERLKREEEEDQVRESERQPTEASPEEVRTEAAKELVALGRQLINAGASMMNSTIRVQAGKSLQPLRSYITKRNCAYRDVEAIIEPLSRLEDGERAAATPVVPKRRHIPDAPNVVSLAARRAL